MALPSRALVKLRSVLKTARDACRAASRKDMRASQMLRHAENAVESLDKHTLSPQMQARVDKLKNEIERARGGEVRIGILLQRLSEISL